MEKNGMEKDIISKVMSNLKYTIEKDLSKNIIIILVIN